MPRTEIPRRSCTGTLKVSARASLILHVPYLQVPLDVVPLRVHRGGGACDQTQEQEFLHDLTSLNHQPVSISAISSLFAVGLINLPNYRLNQFRGLVHGSPHRFA